MMVLNTHLKIDERLCGELAELKDGYARVVLKTTEQMAADDAGLVHGGFLFGAADYAAMAAVNDPNVVLAGSSCKFLAPSKTGETIEFEAKVTQRDGAKYLLEVVGRSNDTTVFSGEFKAVVTKEHVLSGR
jgi:acyl-coenzyme A thioesterase PaaI-like protein